MGNEELNGIIGFKFLGNMNKEELIEELLATYRVQLSTQDIEHLKVNVINARMEEFKNRLLIEAGLAKRGSFFGVDVIEPEENDND